MVLWYSVTTSDYCERGDKLIVSMDIPAWAESGNVVIGLVSLPFFVLYFVSVVVHTIKRGRSGWWDETGPGAVMVLLGLFVLRTAWLWVQEITRVIWGW